MADLEETIRVSGQAMEAIPEGHPDRAARLNNLGVSLSNRYLKTGAIADLEEAIRVGRQAVDATPDDHPDRAAWLNNLGIHLEDRYLRTEAIADLEEAIRVGRQAVDAMPNDHPDLAALLNNLGMRLRDRYLRTGAIADLEEAIRVGRQAVNVTLNDHPDRAAWLNSLGIHLGDRYSRTGAIADLEEAIRVGRQAVDTTPDDHPEQVVRLNNLGVSLSNRYLRIGAIADLEEAIRVGRQAVNVTLNDHPDRAAWLNNLGVCLKDRYSRMGALADLEEAIRVGRQAVNITSNDHPDLAAWLNSLGIHLRDRYSRTGALADLEEAIRVGRQAVDAMPNDHPDLAALLNNLEMHLKNRYSRTEAIADLEEAIRVGRQAVDVTPDDHPDLAALLNNLSICLRNRYSRTGAIADLEEAQKYLQTALHQANSVTMDRINAARRALQICAFSSDWQQAYEISNIAVPLIPKLSSRSLENSDKQHMLSQVVGLASNAAAAALHAGKGPLIALEFLEQGRGALATSLEELRTDILDLKKTYPELAEKFNRLRSEFDLPIGRNTSSIDEIPNSTRQAQISRRYEAGQELDSLIDEIRKQPGFEDFLQAPSEGEMRAAASHGPIVIMNISEYRCDAIIVEQDRIRSLALSHLNSTEIRSKAEESNLGSFHILEWLWDVVMHPILDALGFTGPPSENNWPRVWWIPTGPLSKFPLHAAGRHAKGSSETVLDRVMSSYSSSVKAVVHGRRPPPSLSTSIQALLVAMEHTPGNDRLPFATKEVAMLHSVCESPIEPGRHKQDVISHLPHCKIFHFAGHGYTDNNDPSKSHLRLEDWKDDPLTVATILEMNIRESLPFLAYLSACGTGRIRNEKFVDESIHLISAFQLAGFRHVIGTLWEVNDEPCVDMARITYTTMKKGGFTDESVCRGLHLATKELRDRWLNDVLLEDQDNAQNANEGGDRDDRIPRDAAFVDDEDDQGTGSLLWVPYVHFGV